MTFFTPGILPEIFPAFVQGLHKVKAWKLPETPVEKAGNTCELCKKRLSCDQLTMKLAGEVVCDTQYALGIQIGLNATR